MRKMSSNKPESRLLTMMRVEVDSNELPIILNYSCATIPHDYNNHAFYT